MDPSLETLVERYEPEVIDVPGGRARIRLVAGEAEWDVVIDGDARGARAPPERARRRHAERRPATWKRIARDVRGGMSAFQRGRLPSATTCTSASASWPRRAA